MGSYDGEVLHALRWGGVGYVHCDLDVVADRAGAGLEGARESALRELEPERERVATAGQDGQVALQFLWKTGKDVQNRYAVIYIRGILNLYI